MRELASSQTETDALLKNLYVPVSGGSPAPKEGPKWMSPAASPAAQARQNEGYYVRNRLAAGSGTDGSLDVEPPHTPLGRLHHTHTRAQGHVCDERRVPRAPPAPATMSGSDWGATDARAPTSEELMHQNQARLAAQQHLFQLQLQQQQQQQQQRH